jgi:sporulation protein YlmC with PRC-barrel domain
MNIEYEMAVMDKNGKNVGEINHIVVDGWSGEPRKFMVRLDDNVSAVFFTPDNVVDVTEGKVTLNISFEDMVQT